MAEKKVIRVLALDGGGIRGVIPATFCKHLETILGTEVPIWKLFDFIVGTSTGGVMAMLLSRPDPDHPGQAQFTAEDCINLYLQHGKDLFFAPPEYMAKNADQKLPMFPLSSVVDTLQKFLPRPGCELKDSLTQAAATAYDIAAREPVLFSSFNARRHPDENFYMRDVAQATSAFPGLFPAAEIASVGGERKLLCIDGGMSGANPAMQSYQYAYQVTKAPESLLNVEDALNLTLRQFAPGAPAIRLPLLFADPVDPDIEIIVVSLGTGHYIAPIDYDRANGWGFAQWGPLVSDVMFDATTHVVADQAETFLGVNHCFRFQINLPADLSGTATVSDVQTLHDLAEKALEPGGLLHDEFNRLRAELLTHTNLPLYEKSAAVPA